MRGLKNTLGLVMRGYSPRLSKTESLRERIPVPFRTHSLTLTRSLLSPSMSPSLSSFRRGLVQTLSVCPSHPAGEETLQRDFRLKPLLLLLQHLPEDAETLGVSVALH